MSTRQEHQLSLLHEIPYYELEAQWTRRNVRDATQGKRARFILETGSLLRRHTARTSLGYHREYMIRKAHGPPNGSPSQKWVGPRRGVAVCDVNVAALRLVLHRDSRAARQWQCVVLVTFSTKLVGVSIGNDKRVGHRGT